MFRKVCREKERKTHCRQIAEAVTPTKRGRKIGDTSPPTPISHSSPSVTTYAYTYSTSCTHTPPTSVLSSLVFSFDFFDSTSPKASQTIKHLRYIYVANLILFKYSEIL
ncbi:hypothetical protein XENOCAPTIV_016285 [Xenoophorus captivus]|uniref:Uncharacterized protein n=1 Tax=Xenoophorus captivus TaxID=1517983 RepID=A0ABV0RU73_9TELE